MTTFPMTSGEDIGLLFKLLKTRNFHLVFAQFFHYDSIRELVSRIRETYPELRIAEIDLDKADVPALRSFLTQAENNDVVLFHNFNALLRKGNEDIRIYLNQRRDALASHPITYIAFVDGAEHMKRTSHLMPDLWSFRSLVLELPLPELNRAVGETLVPLRTGGQEISEPVDMEEIERLEKRWRELLAKPEASELVLSYLVQLLNQLNRIPDPRQRLLKLQSMSAVLNNIKLGNVSWQKAPILDAIGMAYSSMAHYDEAIRYLQHALDLSIAAFGAQNAMVAVELNNLGSIWCLKGEYHKAIDYHEQALKIVRKAYGEEHKLMATTFSHLGDSMNSKGEYDKAIDYYQQALRIYRDVFGDENSNVATTLSKIGSVWTSKGEYDKALNCFDRALKLYRKDFGTGHPNVATSLNNLGNAWKLKGEYEKAIELYQQSMDITRKFFGEKHPNVATSLNNLGLAWKSKGDSDKAIEYYEQALTIDREILGDEHPNVAIGLNNLGVPWIVRCEYDKAIEYHEQALKIDRKVFGAMHPSIGIDFINLGAAFFAKKEYTTAITYFEKAMHICVRFLGEEHPDSKNAQAWLEQTRLALASQTPPSTT